VVGLLVNMRPLPLHVQLTDHNAEDGRTSVDQSNP
jgi:hypothetical protein